MRRNYLELLLPEDGMREAQHRIDTAALKAKHHLMWGLIELFVPWQQRRSGKNVETAASRSVPGHSPRIPCTETVSLVLLDQTTSVEVDAVYPTVSKGMH